MARRGVAAGVSKENVSPDQPRSSPLASAFDATAEIFTTFDLAFRREILSPSSDWWTLATPCTRKGDSRSPEHYQPLCMPDASALMCRHTRERAHMCARARARQREKGRAADSTTITYASTYGRHIGIGMYRDGVGFRSAGSSGLSIRHGRSNGSYFRYRGVISRGDKRAGSLKNISAPFAGASQLARSDSFFFFTQREREFPNSPSPAARDTEMVSDDDGRFVVCVVCRRRSHSHVST